MSSELAGKVAVVTGAGRGIGAAIAVRLGEAGATVVVSDIDEGAARKVAENIPGATYALCDVTSEDQVKALMDGAVAAHGGVHLVVPNAGVGVPCPLLAMDLAAWRRTTSVNLDGVFLTLRYGAAAIIASGGGSIVNVASVTALDGLPLVAPYAAAKAAVVNLTKTAAIEFREQGVRVNAVLPGFVDTELVSEAAVKADEILGLPAGTFGGMVLARQGRLGTPEEVAEAVLWLASDKATFCNGSGLVLDGGCTSGLL
jgi:NAD(P)-dependent dehydrogenase (short-subunit alcohol dehydrogenase family)